MAKRVQSENVAGLQTDSEKRPTYTIQKRRSTRWWEVLDPAGELVCLTVYKRGATEVVRRLSG